jgi:predicted restriction endonuclease
VTRVVVAAYDSVCGLCGGRIVEGDEIVAIDDEWCHAQCAEDDGEELER